MLSLAWRPAIGSSPRTRGTARSRPIGQSRRRFIPAHAGNSPSSSSRCGGMPVHPRARGEQSLRSSGAASYSGSSPRTRGTGAGHTRHSFGRRFIPAHAGNRGRVELPCVTRTVHPRARGEQCWRAGVASFSRGSSPRTRGTVRAMTSWAPSARFIPAHAGNRRKARTGARSTPVHPRARGEQQNSCRHLQPISGSSPRTRGTVRIACGRHAKMRFIPAHAGNSQAHSRVDGHRPVHPRARGKQLVAGLSLTRIFHACSQRRAQRGIAARI